MSAQENILDGLQESNGPIEAKLMQRINALVCDSILLFAFYYVLKQFVFISYSSMALSFTVMLYKPFMEYLFGGTIGKMFVKIKVCSLDHETPSMLQVIIRNILPISYQLSTSCLSRTLGGMETSFT